MGRVIAVLLLASLCACAANGSGSNNAGAGFSARPAEDVARDAGRQPFAVLDFLGVEPGMVALDIMAGAGYYTEVLAQRVGPDGRVYAHNTAGGLRFRGGANDLALAARLFGNRLPNVRRLDREFSDLGLVANSVDVAITALNFHDVYNASPEAAAGVLQAIKYVLKPGGVLGIIDHAGNAGADNASLHRMEAAQAVAAAQAAGFVVESSDLLANPDDDRSQGPFAPGLRGQTDRFLLKLTKPE